MQGKFLRTNVTSECDKILKGLSTEIDSIRNTGFMDGTSPEDKNIAQGKIDKLESVTTGVSMIRAFSKAATGDKNMTLDSGIFDFMWQTGAFRS